MLQICKHDTQIINNNYTVNFYLLLLTVAIFADQYFNKIAKGNITIVSKQCN